MSKQLSLSAVFSVLTTAALALSLAMQGVLGSGVHSVSQIALPEAPAFGTSHN